MYLALSIKYLILFYFYSAITFLIFERAFTRVSELSSLERLVKNKKLVLG